MAKRGRPSKTSQEQILKQDAGKIAKRFLSYPLREPVGPLFDPYYQRILKGDLAAVLDYCESNCGTFILDASFYELIGRLLFLQHHVAAAKQIVAEITRRLVHLTGPPDNVDEEYGHWYRWLRILSESARQFIRERYKADDSVTCKQLWHEYINRHYVTNVYGFSNQQKETPRSQAIKELDTFGEQFCADRDWLVDLVERFWSHGLVPKVIFDELAASDRRADARAERDKRYRHRRFRSTPSFIARKYACAMVGLSTGSVSHKK